MSSPNRTKLEAAGRKMRPSWQTYHALGAPLMKVLPPHQSLNEIGRTFGISKQMAYHECAVALGKIVFKMRQQIPDWKQS